MRKSIALLLALSLAALTACGREPIDSIAASSEAVSSSAAASESEETPAPTEAAADSAAEETPAADTTDEQRNVLNGFVDFASDTAGGSLKTARAAAALVEYLSYADIDADIAADWMASLSEDQRTLLDINWSGILENAQNIATDPASQADLLSSAGITTDFEGMVLTEVPDKLVTLNTVLTGKAG